jgi:hypothetical protein
VSVVDSNGRTTFVADAHRDDGKRYVVRADEKLTAFSEREPATLKTRTTSTKPNAVGLRSYRFHSCFAVNVVPVINGSESGVG